jgi:hypothetical protein
MARARPPGLSLKPGTKKNLLVEADGGPLGVVTAGRLPLPSDRPEFVALLDQQGPDLLEDPVLAPPLEPAVDRAVVAVVLGELVPLTSGSEAEADAVERRSPIDAGSPPFGAGCGWAIFPEDRLDPLPEFVVEFPDGRERFVISSNPSQSFV